MPNRYQDTAQNIQDRILNLVSDVRQAIALPALIGTFTCLPYLPKAANKPAQFTLKYSARLSGPTSQKFLQWAATRADIFGSYRSKIVAQSSVHSPLSNFGTFLASIQDAYGIRGVPNVIRPLKSFDFPDLDISEQLPKFLPENIDLEDCYGMILGKEMLIVHPKDGLGSGVIANVFKAYKVTFETSNSLGSGLTTDRCLKNISSVQPVAWKVRRGQVDSHMRRDLRRLNALGDAVCGRDVYWADILKKCSPFDIYQCIDSFDRLMKPQLNLITEAKNLIRLRSNFSIGYQQMSGNQDEVFSNYSFKKNVFKKLNDSRFLYKALTDSTRLSHILMRRRRLYLGDVHVPRLFQNWTVPGSIVMEYERGVPLSTVLSIKYNLERKDENMNNKQVDNLILPSSNIFTQENNNDFMMKTSSNNILMSTFNKYYEKIITINRTLKQLSIDKKMRKLLEKELINKEPILTVHDFKGLTESGVFNRFIAYLCSDMMLQMIFRNKFIHGDLHPGNMLIRRKNQNNKVKNGNKNKKRISSLDYPGGNNQTNPILNCFIELWSNIVSNNKNYEALWELVLLDGGLCCDLSANNWSSIKDTFGAILKNNVHSIGPMMSFREPQESDPANVEIFSNRIANIVSKYYDSSLNPRKIKNDNTTFSNELTTTYEEIKNNDNRIESMGISVVITELLQAAYDCNVKLRSDFVQVGLSVALFDGLRRALDSGVDFISVAIPWTLTEYIYLK